MDTIPLDIPTLAAVIMGALLAFEGYQRRKKVAAPPLVIDCPNKIEKLWPELEAMRRDTESLRLSVEMERDFIKKMLELHEARDSDGIPRWYCRDQGKVVIASLSVISKKLDHLDHEFEVMNRRNGGTRR